MGGHDCGHGGYGGYDCGGGRGGYNTDVGDRRLDGSSHSIERSVTGADALRELAGGDVLGAAYMHSNHPGWLAVDSARAWHEYLTPGLQWLKSSVS